ncbi:hypothetical protein R1sor_006469 [Riccia sorocarpa]|uniref:DNA-directed RNA polymerase subunit n=1 Tax=Riccia sorocarpa TaxID=122646 RepID=A0ABD3HN27_9MARC
MEKPKRGKLVGIQFDVLRSQDIFKLSVIEEESINGVIEKPKDLYDARLGVPNERGECETCRGKTRGGPGAARSCDGHFGHIELPSAIYHPYHVRRVFKFLKKICLSCSRALKKKERPNLLILDGECDSRDPGKAKKVTRKRKLSETGFDKKAAKSRRPNDIMGWLNTLNEEGDAVHTLDVRNGIWKAAVSGRPPKTSSLSPPITLVKEEPLDYSDLDASISECGRLNIANGATQKSESKKRTTGISGSANGVVRAVPQEAEEFQRQGDRGKVRLDPMAENTTGSTEKTCRLCGKGCKEPGMKYPKLNLRVVSKVKRNGRIEAIEMFVEEKVGQLPTGFWDFVKGHPGSETEKSRLLLPFEALKILRDVPFEDYEKLKYDRIVTHPEAFILFAIPVTPNCNRLIMDDWNSTLMPRVILGRGGPNSKLEALVSKVKQIKSSGELKKTFRTESIDIEELQLLVARHMRACKVVDFSSSGKQNGSEKQETGGSLELKWLKAHILSKRSNYSARNIVNGDPNLRVDEIGIPKEVALRLTIKEEVNRLNLSKWQKIISGGKSGKTVRLPGPLLLETPEGEFDLGKKCARLTVKIGNFVTRPLQNGDYVFANRPPSLHKHSLIALKVKIHEQLTFAINPLICAPFDGDFDGDAFHIFVPQSVESMAEQRELMSVSAQMVCPQGGQSMINLTQDTLVGGYMLTRSHLFLNRSEMSQLSMFCNAGLPPPAVIKCPARKGPLWTGAQLYSMLLPHELNYRSADGDILVHQGELLMIGGGSAGWLQASANGLVKAICESAGSDAAVRYLNSAQVLLHQWLLNRGFSVGLQDYYVAKDRESRSTLVRGVEKCLRMSDEAALRQVLKLDRSVQERVLSPKPNPQEKLQNIKHEGCFGLLLGDNRNAPKIKDLQRSAVEKYQSIVPIIDNLIYGYMDSGNSLHAMVKSGSKGSTGKLIQQTACLGLQLYKGESLLAVDGPNNKLFYCNQSLKFRKEDIFDNKDEIIEQPGYWESKGIVRSSFFDGLNPAEFYLHAVSSRSSMLREGIEEPNKIMRNLFLFMRDLYVAYDGSVRNRTGNMMIQFEYGGLDEEKVDTPCKAADMAGEPVGALAATAIAEPCYSVKLDSYHSSSRLKAGPLQLLQETVFPRRKSTLKATDRTVILRLLPGIEVHRRALRLKRELEKVPLSKFVSSWALEFSADGGLYERVYYENLKPSYENVIRSCPWQCRILLNKKVLRDYDLDVTTIKTRLNREFNTASSKEGQPSLIFVTNTKFASSSRSGVVDDYLVFFPHESGTRVLPFTTPASEPVKEARESAVDDKSKQVKKENKKIDVQNMFSVIVPNVLKTTVKGHNDIESIKIVWEDGDDASRVPVPSLHPQFMSRKRVDPGELILEVLTTKAKGGGKRGAAFSAVKNASLLFTDDINWTRSSPYSIQEINHVFGVEAAWESMRKRLVLATKEMGRAVRREHLTLVADTMTFTGEVVGLSLSGYKEYCGESSVSTPFTEATFQEPKKKFFEAAAEGARDSLEGALASAVWGRPVPLGTGADFETVSLLPSSEAYVTGSLHKSLFGTSCKFAKGALGCIDPLKTGNRRSIKENKGSTEKVQVRKPPARLRKKSQSSTAVNGKGITLNGVRMLEDDFRKDVNIDLELQQKLQTLLHDRYKVGDRVDIEFQKLLLEDVLQHHPRRHSSRISRIEVLSRSSDGRIDMRFFLSEVPFTKGRKD